MSYYHLLHRTFASLIASAVVLLTPHGRAEAPTLPNTPSEIVARLADVATVELDVERAATILRAGSSADAAVARADVRRRLYAMDCEGAWRVGTDAQLDKTDEGAELLHIARGCLFAFAGAIHASYPEFGLMVHLQDDRDAVLLPWIIEATVLMRRSFEASLGTVLPSPVHVAIVRDQFSLSNVTGLPLSAAQTTGITGIAKWGRVTIVSPRSADHGYAWLDTLGHELTHLAVTRASLDRSPLWLQEGLARWLETSWRTSHPLDDTPSSDLVAMWGFQQGLARSFHQMGSSFALLPSAEEASVAYAQVHSFVQYVATQSRPSVFKELLEKLRIQLEPNESKALEELTGRSIEAWTTPWREDLQRLSNTTATPPWAPKPDASESARHARLGELLLNRNHADAAVAKFTEALALNDKNAAVRAELARARWAQGNRETARAMVEQADAIDGHHAAWWTLHGALAESAAEALLGSRRGVELDPWSPFVACETLVPPNLPQDPDRQVLCAAARQTEGW